MSWMGLLHFLIAGTCDHVAKADPAAVPEARTCQVSPDPTQMNLDVLPRHLYKQAHLNTHVARVLCQREASHASL